MYLIPAGGIIDSWCRPARETGLAKNKEEEAPVSSEDKNKALARRFLEAFANGDLHTLDELLSFVFNTPTPLTYNLSRRDALTLCGPHRDGPRSARRRDDAAQ